MKALLVAVAVAGLTGCESQAQERARLMVEYYDETHIAANRTSSCINSHLGSMADADHVQKWDAALYDSVARECNKLFLEEVKP